MNKHNRKGDSMKYITFKRILTAMILGSMLITSSCSYAGNGTVIPGSSQSTTQGEAPDEAAESSQEAPEEAPLTAISPLTDIALDGGLFSESQEIGKDFLLSYDIDRLAVSLFRFSENIGKAPVDMNNGYYGWENTGENGIGGHTYGHFMSACVNMYMQTGDERFKDIVTRGVELLSIAQSEDGFVAGFSRKNLDYVFDNPNDFWAGGNNDAHLQGIWAPWYTIHKIMAGLIDAYEYMGIDEALVCAEKLASYAKNGTDKLNDEQMEKMLIGEHGGINESFAKLYELTGKEEYIELAKRFSHKKIMDPLSRGENNLPGLHANTQIPKIVGAAKIYQLTGDEYYKNVAKSFWKYTVETQLYANGGTSDREFFTKVNEEPLSNKNCETCCVYNMLKLTEYIFSWNQDSKYADYYENALFNQILGSQHSDGRKTYSVDLSMGASTEFLSRENFECCLGTGMENPGRYTHMIYANADGELYVNLFISSVLDWSDKGITLTQKSEYPYEGKSVLTIDTKEPVSAVINLRIPYWTDGYTVSVNGEKQDIAAENGYLALNREWQSGDKIELDLPMSLGLYVSRDNDSKVAFKYGGILLAGDLGTNPVKSIISSSRNPEDFITKSDDGLTFELNGYNGGSITLKPFFEFETEPHMVYWYLFADDEAGSDVEMTSSEKLDGVTVDRVVPGHMQSETDHNFSYEGNSSTGIHSPAAQDGCNGSWRDVIGGYISYDLKVDPDRTNYLLSMFWGSDGPGMQERIFDIYVNGELMVDDYVLNNNNPDKIDSLYVELPEDMTKGKETVTVRYQADDGKQAGGVFGIRIVTEIAE